MDEQATVCLLNDSFPPLIDGVVNAVMNYAKVLPASGFSPVVVTPDHPDADDSGLPYPVIRYPSIDFRDKTGYMAGVPFSPEIVRKLEGRKISVLHSHCPIASTILARELRSPDTMHRAGPLYAPITTPSVSMPLTFSGLSAIFIIAPSGSVSTSSDLILSILEASSTVRIPEVTAAAYSPLL